MSEDGKVGALSASEATNLPVFRQARMLAVTCCYGASHFARALLRQAELVFFVGNKSRYLWADVRKLFGVDGDADPFWRAASFGSLCLAEGGNHALVLQRMLMVYVAMLDVYEDRRLNTLPRAVVYMCLLNNIRQLRSVRF
jgi:hypothetical protein